MRLEPLYRLSFRYRRAWQVDVAGERHQLLHGVGRCEGRITGAFHGTNRARRRPDGAFEPDYHGVIETDDGATILWHLTGYGFPDEGRVSAAVAHLSDDARYVRLNRVLCAVAGDTVRDEQGVEITLDVAELVWQPLERDQA